MQSAETVLSVTAVTALLPVLSRVFRPWPTATPGSVPTTAVYPDVAEPSAKPLFVSTAGSYPGGRGRAIGRRARCRPGLLAKTAGGRG